MNVGRQLPNLAGEGISSIQVIALGRELTGARVRAIAARPRRRGDRVVRLDAIELPLSTNWDNFGCAADGSFGAKSEAAEHTDELPLSARLRSFANTMTNDDVAPITVIPAPRSNRR